VITNAIIGIIVVVVGFFDGLLPSIGVPSWFTTNATAGTAADIGNALSAVKNVLPVDALLTVLHAFLLFLPLALGYLIFNWVWNHSPTIMGTSL
jgi:hypothetical protein